MGGSVLLSRSKQCCRNEITGGCAGSSVGLVFSAVFMIAPGPTASRAGDKAASRTAADQCRPRGSRSPSPCGPTMGNLACHCRQCCGVLIESIIPSPWKRQSSHCLPSDSTVIANRPALHQSQRKLSARRTGYGSPSTRFAVGGHNLRVRSLSHLPHRVAEQRMCSVRTAHRFGFIDRF